MAPLLVSALVGVGVKLATDFLMSGVKKFMDKGNAGATPSASFASTLDKARAGSATASAGNGMKTVATDASLADRSRILAADVTGGMPAPGRAQGVDSYRRLAELSPQAP
jgi:hypothetical protein